MARQHFHLPDPGEGLTEAEIVTWRVAAGDTVAVNDVVIEVETAKSLVELPIPFAGTVAELLVAEGDTVDVGAPIIAVETSTATSTLTGAETETVTETHAGGTTAGAPEAATSDDAASPEPASEAPVPNLVGYGAKEGGTRRRRRSASPPSTSTPAPAPPSTPVSPAASGGGPQPAVARALAKPPVRKLAKDLGLDLTAITPTGEGGVVTRADVEAARATAAEPTSSSPSTPAGVDGRAPDQRIPIKGVRKATAAAMVASAFTAPHVTEWLTVDVTRTMELLERLKGDRAYRDVKVTPLAVVAKALCLVARRHPGINASWDEAAQEIVVRGEVDLGIAAATPRGLLVPTIKGAGRLELRDLAVAITELAATAREGRTPPAALTGGSITITNVGVFGVDAGTPILNPGEAAILAFGAVRRMPWVVTAEDGSESVQPRWVTQLALSFDHRLVDGELGSRVLADLGALLHDPGQALLWS